MSLDLHETYNNNIKLTSQLSLKDPLSTRKEVKIRNVFHCDGLLLCTTENSRLVVWNPLLRENRWIQPRNPYKELDYFALGKSSCNKYKILRVDQSNYMEPASLEFEVYDFTSNSWRVVGKTRDWCILRFQSRGMTVKGQNTYWLAVSQQDHRRGDLLLSFDFTTERFEKVSLPGDHLSFHNMALSVTRKEQQLCLLATRGMHVLDIDVWIANEIESNGAASWSKFLSVDLANLHQPFRFYNGMNFLVDRENKVLVCRSKPWLSEDFLHVVGEDKCIQVYHNDEEFTCSLVLSYVPTLVQIQ